MIFTPENALQNAICWIFCAYIKVLKIFLSGISIMSMNYDMCCEMSVGAKVCIVKETSFISSIEALSLPNNE